MEIVLLTKPNISKDFAFLTLTTEEIKDELLNNGLAFHYERLKVIITKDTSTGSLSDHHISTTLVANNLPQRES